MCVSERQTEREGGREVSSEKPGEEFRERVSVSVYVLVRERELLTVGEY